MKTVLAIDASWYLHRAFHVLRFRKTFSNLHRVIPGQVLNMIVKDALDVHATHVAVCFDAPRSFRYDIYPRYKEGRSETTLAKVLGDVPAVTREVPASVLNTNVYSFLSELRDACRAAGFKCLKVKARESDDLMAAVARTFATKKGVRVLLATRDKDLMQMVCANVNLYWPRSGVKDATFVDAAEVLNQRCVHPHQVRDQLCIMGDAVDGIPGIRGYSIKKSAKILEDHGSIAQALKSKTKDGDTLRKHLPALKLARALVNLETTCWSGSLSDLAVSELDAATLTKVVGYVPDKLKQLHNEASTAAQRGLFE